MKFKELGLPQSHPELIFWKGFKAINKLTNEIDRSKIVSNPLIKNKGD